VPVSGINERHGATEGVVAAVGGALVVAAIAANQRWLDHHFLPSFYLQRDWYVSLETMVRAVILVTGASMALVVRRRIGQAVGRSPGRTLQVIIAAALALGASEIVLRRTHPRPTEWVLPEEEPRRIADPRLGWVVAPAHTGHRNIGGRRVEYAVDRLGYRASRADEPIDPSRPTIVFVGESVMFGEGLQWDETIPAQVETMLNVQSANAAVHGYGTDQAYLRLERELPRFRQPLAVVSLFMTELFGRNLDRDRPHLGPGLVWLPPEHGARIASLARFLVPYRREATVTSGIAATRDVLRATVELTRAHGATPLIVVPHFGSEDQAQRALRTRILDDALPSLLVSVDESWHLAGDRHPNARAAHAIASAIAAKLGARPALPSQPF
jgi:hypothetical protein